MPILDELQLYISNIYTPTRAPLRILHFPRAAGGFRRAHPCLPPHHLAAWFSISSELYGIFPAVRASTMCSSITNETNCRQLIVHFTTTSSGSTGYTIFESTAVGRRVREAQSYWENHCFRRVWLLSYSPASQMDGVLVQVVRGC